MRSRVPSLASLIKTADELIAGGSNKQEIPARDLFVEKMASALEETTESVQIEPTKSQPSLTDIEKFAEAVNVLDAAAEIESIKKLEAFREKAVSEGHPEEQIGEAIHKIAAANLKKSMPLLVALGFGAEKTPEPKELTSRLMAYSRQMANSNAKTQGY